MNKPLRLMFSGQKRVKTTTSSVPFKGLSLDDIKREEQIRKKQEILKTSVGQSMDSEMATNARTSLRMRNRKEFLDDQK